MSNLGDPSGVNKFLQSRVNRRLRSKSGKIGRNPGKDFKKLGSPTVFSGKNRLAQNVGPKQKTKRFCIRCLQTELDYSNFSPKENKICDSCKKI